MRPKVIPGVSWVDSWVASHFSAALCCVPLQEKQIRARTGPDGWHHSIAHYCAASDWYRICQ